MNQIYFVYIIFAGRKSATARYQQAHLRGRYRKVTTRQHEKNNFFKEMTYGGDKPLFSFLKKERTIAHTTKEPFNAKTITATAITITEMMKGGRRKG